MGTVGAIASLPLSAGAGAGRGGACGHAGARRGSAFIEFGLQDLIGLAIFVTALIGETEADAQLTRFRADPAHHGQICEIGLWGRSRHPNYFFEWLTWVAFAVVATDFGIGAVAWIAPALMYWTLRYVSGVPPIEERMLQTRGEAFGAYRIRTPTFFPRLF